MSNLAYKTEDGKNGMEPSLLDAAKLGNIELAKTILENNPERITERDNMGSDALHLAIFSFHEDFANYLLDSTAISLLVKDGYGRTALDIALIGGSEELCEKLFDRWQEEYFSHVNDEGYFVDPNAPSL